MLSPALEGFTPTPEYPDETRVSSVKLRKALNCCWKPCRGATEKQRFFRLVCYILRLVRERLHISTVSDQKGLPLGQLIVVSNRVAVPERSTSTRAGGLEVAVNAALNQRSGTWFGWSGKIATQETIATQRVVHKDITFITIDLSREDHQEYYRGFANRVLWPIFHYRIDLAEFSRRDLSGYLRVNDNFARHLDKVLGPDDLVWVHDYHLLPLAKALRERGHKNRIGFFLHIPCPPPEMLTVLPHHERLIPSLCDYDLIGFQTGDDAFNFSRYLTRECGLHSRDFNFVVADRTIRIGVFPSVSKRRHLLILPGNQCDCH